MVSMAMRDHASYRRVYQIRFSLYSFSRNTSRVDPTSVNNIFAANTDINNSFTSSHISFSRSVMHSGS